MTTADIRLLQRDIRRRDNWHRQCWPLSRIVTRISVAFVAYRVASMACVGVWRKAWRRYILVARMCASAIVAYLA